jgi:hypothetical protein
MDGLLYVLLGFVDIHTKRLQLFFVIINGLLRR